MVDRVVNERIDKWINRGEVEWVSEFAQPVPQTVMANIPGWPIQDLTLLQHFGDGTVKPFVYGSKHNNILPEEDMITFLTQVEYSPLKRKLVDLEIKGIVYAMVTGGLETTQYAIAEQVQLLIDNPQVWQSLKDYRSKIRAFIEEGMRLRSPTQGLSTFQWASSVSRSLHHQFF